MRDEVYDMMDPVVHRYYYNGEERYDPGRRRTVKHTRRADAKSTRRLADGSYGFPTEYESFHLTTTSEAGEAEWYAGVHSVLPPQHWRSTWESGGDADVGYHGTAFLRPNIPVGVYSRARSRAIDMIKSSQLELAVTMAEAYKSAVTLLDLLFDAIAILRKMYRFSPRQIASDWLRYQYGLRPLMNDAVALVDAILYGLDQPAGKVKVVEFDDDYSLPAPFGSKSFEGSVQRGVELSYTFTVSDTDKYKRWRMGLADPLGLVWELTPYSFVVDWFLHIGDFLSALTGPQGLSLVSGYQTAWLRNDILVKDIIMGPNDIGNFPESGSIKVVKPGTMKCWVRTRTHYREVLNSFAIPWPYLDIGLSRTQVASALALLGASKRHGFQS